MGAPWDPIPIYNDSGEDIPAFAVVQLADEHTDGAVNVVKPTVDGARYVLVNGPAAIPTGGTGQAFASPRVVVAYDVTAGAPVAGDEWGAVSGSWLLGNVMGGFLIFGKKGNGILNALRGPGPGTVTECILVTSLTKTDDRYPGQIQDYDVATKTWSDRVAQTPDCWIVEKNDLNLQLQRYEDCRFRGYRSADGLPVFTCLMDGVRVQEGSSSVGVPQSTVRFDGGGDFEVDDFPDNDTYRLRRRVKSAGGYINDNAIGTTFLDEVRYDTDDIIVGDEFVVPTGLTGYWLATISARFVSRDSELSLLGSSGAGGGVLYTDPVQAIIDVSNPAGTVNAEDSDILPDTASLGMAMAASTVMYLTEGQTIGNSITIVGPCNWPGEIWTTATYLGAKLTTVSATGTPSGDKGDSGTNFTLTPPSGIAEGALLVVIIAVQANTATPAAPSGSWTKTDLFATGTTHPRIAVYTKIATGDDAQTWTMSSQVWCAHAYAFANAVKLQASGGTSTETGTGNRTLPAVNNYGEDRVLIQAYASASLNSWTIVTGGSVAEQSMDGAAYDLTLASGYQLLANLGTTGTRSATITGADNSTAAMFIVRG